MIRVEGITTAERRATYRRRSVVQLTDGGALCNLRQDTLHHVRFFDSRQSGI